MLSVSEQYAIYRDNAVLPILQTLADMLDVPVDVLDALGVGWKIEDNAWTFPERDASGKIIGLVRRYWDGKKYCIAGSKRGLTYAAVPATKGYDSARQRWRRVSEAESCPICGNAGWCGLDDNTSPPRFVRCMRQSEGAVHHDVKQGHIHELVPGAFIPKGRGKTPLAISTHPILIVEGATDVAAALSLGLQAVGRPSNTGGIQLLCQLVAGRSVIVIGENDRKADGTWPGREGMEKVFEALRQCCPEVRKLLPPIPFKDLRAWIQYEELTADQLIQAVQGGSQQSNDELLESSAPLDIAERWLRDEQTVDDHLILRSWNGVWYQYNGHEYTEMPSDSGAFPVELRSGLYKWLSTKTYRHFGSKGEVVVKQYLPDKAKITNIADALLMSCPVFAQAPCWLDDRESPCPADLIVFQNGTLDVGEYVHTGRLTLIPSTADLFHLAAVPYAFDAGATCPQWETFLTQVFAGDEERIALLQEWYGYNLVADTSMEKMMLLIGRPGSGKSTALEVFQAMMGLRRFGVTSFGQLTSPFGLHTLLGCLALIMPDAHVPRSSDRMQALELLKSIVGQDRVPINRKYLPVLTNIRLPGRITMAANELPDLVDHARALERRLLVLHFSESFEGHEDRTLKIRLPTEAPGVLVWALKGLRRLRHANQFTEPKNSAAMAQELRQALTPIAEFLDDCCILGSQQKNEKRQLFDCWLTWTRERGLLPGVASRFARRLFQQHPGIMAKRTMAAGVRQSWFVGIALTPEAKERYLTK